MFKIIASLSLFHLQHLKAFQKDEDNREHEKKSLSSGTYPLRVGGGMIKNKQQNI